MTEVTTVAGTGANGAAAAGAIEVENPSTGKVIAHVPVVPPEQVAELVEPPGAHSPAGRRSASTVAPPC